MDVKVPQKAQLSVADLPPATVRHPCVANVSVSFVSLGLSPSGISFFLAPCDPPPTLPWCPHPRTCPPQHEVAGHWDLRLRAQDADPDGAAQQPRPQEDLWNKLRPGEAFPIRRTTALLPHGASQPPRSGHWGGERRLRCGRGRPALGSTPASIQRMPGALPSPSWDNPKNVPRPRQTSPGEHRARISVQACASSAFPPTPRTQDTGAGGSGTLWTAYDLNFYSLKPELNSLGREGVIDA